MNKKSSLVAGALAATLLLSSFPAQAATPVSITLFAAPSRYQGAVITLTITEGALQIRGALAPGLEPGLILLEGIEPRIEPLQLQASADGQLEATHLLPAGTYTLTIAPAVWQGLTITGPDLKAATAVPQITLTAKPFANANEGASLAPITTGASALLWSGPNGQSGAFNPAGTGFEPLTLPTTNLADGLYVYTLLAPNAETGNVGIAMQPILIDRVATFPDLPEGHWARRWVEVSYHLQIVSGRPDGLFAPEANVTRGEFAKLLAATLGLQGGTAAFVDVEEHWASPWIQALGDAGIVKGDIIDGQAYFHPDRTISRQEAAAMVARAFALQASSTTPTFSDWSEVDSWATGPVTALVGEGWLSGFPDGTFGPRRLLSRSQAAKLLGATFGM